MGNIERDEQGHITKVNGFHKRVGPASKELYERLRDNGAAPEILERLFPEYVQLDNSEINPASHLMNPIIEEPANPVVVRPAPPRENSVVENPAVQHVVPTINNPIVENLIVQQEQEPDQASDIIRPADMNNSISLSENHNGKSTITTSSNSVQPRMYPGNRRVRVVQKGVTSVPHRE